MAVQIKNETQLTSIFVPKLKEAVDYIVQKIWNENRELIRLIVYESYQPSRYNRTGEFKEAWDTKSSTKGNHIEGEFYYDWNKLTPGDDDPESPRYGQHVSAIDRFLMTEYLAEVIYQGKAGPAFGHGVHTGAWADKRDAWSALDKWLSNSTFRKIFEEGMTKAGIPWKKSIGGVHVEKSK